MIAPAEFVIDLQAFDANLAAIRERVAPAEHMLVVKDDAYAHGLEPILTRAWSQGVRWIGALDVVTGVRARQILGDEARIFAWMVNGQDDIADAIAADLDCGVGSEELLEDIATHTATRAVSQPLRVHLKIDTGLHRNGVRPERWDAFVARARELELAGHIVVTGIWSHIAEASDAADDDARAVFDDAVARAQAAGLDPQFRHLAASAAAFARPEFRYDMVRIGAFAYGIRSTDGPSDADLGITPIGTVEASVVEVSPSQTVLNVGADGLISLAAAHLAVDTPQGLRRVLDVGDTAMTCEPFAAEPGERVAVYGGQAAETATDVAERIGTIGEEIILRISPLIPRRYLD